MTGAMPTGPIGRRMLRVEDRTLLTGTAEFADDVQLPGVLHARFVRSLVPHARIDSIDVEAARAAPGVVGVFTAGDVELPPLHPPIANSDAFSPPRPLLASGSVRFAGEAIAVVVADSPYRAEDAAELVVSRLEALPVVVDPERATDAQPIHDHDSNVLYDSHHEVGEVDAAFAEAAVVIERRFRNPRYSAMPIEPRGAVAQPLGDGLRLWSSTQIPHVLAKIVAETLDMRLEDVRVSATDIGGGFGQKAHAYPEEILLAWLARRLERPVKWAEDRSENLLAASHARDQVVSVRAAAAADGKLLALDVDVLCDVGAYGVYPHGHLLEPVGTPAMIPGPYSLRNYRARSRGVATNKCPEGAYRGVGLPVSAFVHERVMDMLARELGLDRAEIRRRNFVESAEMPYTSVTNQRYDSGDYALALDQALTAIGYESFAAEQAAALAEGRLIGLGISSYVEYSGMGSVVFHGRGMVAIPGNDRAWLKLGEDGVITVWTTLPGMGQGVATTFAQMTADALGAEVESVRVERSDTAAGPGGGTGTFASRSAVTGGGAIAEAAGELRSRLIEDAADQLEASPADLEIADGAVRVKGSPSRAVALTELAAAEPERYSTDASFDPPRTVYPYATHACKVEVDPETGRVEVLAYVVAEDCGTVINPLIVEGQTHGAVAQGIGGTLYEELVYDAAGQMITASLMDYLVPTAMELPALELSHLEIPAPESPNGAKGVGEGGTLAPPGAITGAVSHALGVELTELPLTPERVRNAARSGGVSLGASPGQMYYDGPSLRQPRSGDGQRGRASAPEESGRDLP